MECLGGQKTDGGAEQRTGVGGRADVGKGDAVTQFGSAGTSMSTPCCPDPRQGLEAGGTAHTAPEPTSTPPCRRWPPHGGACPTHLQVENAID